MRIVIGAFVACASGCGNLLGIDNFSLGDAGPDGVVTGDSGIASDGADACYGPTGWQMCFAKPPTGVINLAAAAGTFNTDTNDACAPGNPWTNAAQPPACVLAGSTIVVSGMVSTLGVRPLVLLSTDTINITGTLDIASGTRTACNPFPTVPGNSGIGAGGGAGGSFMNAGGNGGMGAGGIAGTVAASELLPDTLLGGCPGQKGGMDNGGNVGFAGPGGGAVFILATNGLTISGTINASGGGAEAGFVDSGGGGGGSGGTIVIYAPTISATGATLIANGGGGGGAGNGAGNGADPDPATPQTPALGGPGSARGGNGFAYVTEATSGSNSNSDGGGGGGGSPGLIETNVVAPGGVLPGVTASPSIGQLF